MHFQIDVFFGTTSRLIIIVEVAEPITSPVIVNCRISHIPSIAACAQACQGRATLVRPVPPA